MPRPGWSYFGRRYYDAEVGRWITPDPLGFEDGFNLYCFVRNRPLLFVDPDGKSSLGLFGEYYEEFANSFIASCVKHTRKDKNAPSQTIPVYTQ